MLNAVFRIIQKSANWLYFFKNNLCALKEISGKNHCIFCFKPFASVDIATKERKRFFPDIEMSTRFFPMNPTSPSEFFWFVGDGFL